MPSDVKVAAAERGIPVLTPIKMKVPQTHEELAAYSPDLIVVAAYGRILPPAILAIPKYGCVNVHASLLPRHRGASPIAHAILAGDRDSGVAIMHMEEGLDTGPVYVERALAIAATDTAGTLSDKLAELGASLLLETLPDIFSGKEPVPQAGEPTYARLLRKEDGWLDFARSAVELERHVRGMQPWPGAFTSKAGERVQVLRARLAAVGRGVAGTVLAAGREGVVVACGEGALVFDEVKPAGKAAMNASAWVAGRQIAIGDVFDAPPAHVSSQPPPVA